MISGKIYGVGCGFKVSYLNSFDVSDFSKEIRVEAKAHLGKLDGTELSIDLSRGRVGFEESKNILSG